MNLKNLLMSGAALMVGILAVGCNENPDGPPTGGETPAAPTQLQATSLSETSVGLKWTASVDTAVTYMVTRVATGTPVDSVSASGLTATAYTSTGLTAREYTFSVVAVRDGNASLPVTVKWAPAKRYTVDGDNASTTIRMYEFASQNGSAIQLDGGPRNVSVKPGTPGLGQLAMFVYPKTNDPVDSVIVGPLYALTEYRTSADFDINKVDSSTYIGPSTILATSLDSWYSTKRLDQEIMTSNQGNVKAYKLMPTNLEASQGFYVRTGSDASGAQHYARVLMVRGAGGSILQGSYPNRYIEVQISYQETPNLPYAKRGTPSPVGVPATLGH